MAAAKELILSGITWVSRAEAARLRGVTPWTIRNWALTKKIQSFMQDGILYVPKDEALNYGRQHEGAIDLQKWQPLVQAVKEHKVSRNAIYNKVLNGRLQHKKVGKTTYVLREEIANHNFKRRTFKIKPGVYEEVIDGVAWITQKEAARIKGVRITTIASLIRDNTVRHTLIEGRVYVNKRDILAHANTQGRGMDEIVIDGKVWTKLVTVAKEAGKAYNAFHDVVLKRGLPFHKVNTMIYVIKEDVLGSKAFPDEIQRDGKTWVNRSVATELKGVSKMTILLWVKNGKLPSIMHKHRLYVPKDMLMALEVGRKRQPDGKPALPPIAAVPQHEATPPKSPLPTSELHEGDEVTIEGQVWVKLYIAAKRMGISRPALYDRVKRKTVACKKIEGMLYVPIEAVQKEQFLQLSEEEIWLNDKIWVSLKAGAQLKNKPTWTLLGWVKSGELASQYARKRYYVPKDDLLAYAGSKDKRRKGGTSIIEGEVWVMQKEAAKLMKVPVTEIAALIKSNALRHKKDGNRVLVSKEELVACRHLLKFKKKEPDIDHEQWIPITEAAKLIGISKSTLRQMQLSGIIQHIKGSKLVYLNKAEVLAYQQAAEAKKLAQIMAKHTKEDARNSHILDPEIDREYWVTIKEAAALKELKVADVRELVRLGKIQHRKGQRLVYVNKEQLMALTKLPTGRKPGRPRKISAKKLLVENKLEKLSLKGENWLFKTEAIRLAGIGRAELERLIFMGKIKSIKKAGLELVSEKDILAMKIAELQKESAAPQSSAKPQSASAKPQSAIRQESDDDIDITDEMWVTVEEAAILNNVSPSAVRNAISSKRLKPFHVGGVVYLNRNQAHDEFSMSRKYR